MKKGKIKMIRSSACFHEGKNYGLNEGEIYAVPADCPPELANDLIRAEHAEEVKPKGAKAKSEKATAAKPETPEGASAGAEKATAEAPETPEG